MKPKLRFPIAILLLCALVLVAGVPANASTHSQSQGFEIGPTKGQVIGIGIAIAALGAAIGVGIYFLVRKTPSITGCAVPSANGLTLRNEGDQQNFLLIGDTAALKPGDRIRVKGKKKKAAAGSRTFLVEKLSKDFGSCKSVAATP